MYLTRAIGIRISHSSAAALTSHSRLIRKACDRAIISCLATSRSLPYLQAPKPAQSQSYGSTFRATRAIDLI